MHDRRQDLTFIVSEMRNGIGHIRSRRRLSGPFFNNARPSFRPASSIRRPSRGLHPTGSSPAAARTDRRLFRFYKLSKRFHPLQVIPSLEESYLVVGKPEEQQLRNSKPEAVRTELSTVKSSYPHANE